MRTQVQGGCELVSFGRISIVSFVFVTIDTSRPPTSRPIFVSPRRRQVLNLGSNGTTLSISAAFSWFSAATSEIKTRPRRSFRNAGCRVFYLMHVNIWATYALGTRKNKVRAAKRTLSKKSNNFHNFPFTFVPRSQARDKIICIFCNGRSVHSMQNSANVKQNLSKATENA